MTRPAKGVQYYRTQFWRVGLLSAPRLPERSGREIHTHVSPSLFNDITRTNLLMRLIIAVSATRRGSCTVCAAALPRRPGCIVPTKSKLGPVILHEV